MRNVKVVAFLVSWIGKKIYDSQDERMWFLIKNICVYNRSNGAKREKMGIFGPHVYEISKIRAPCFYNSDFNNVKNRTYHRI